jgi:hypothetical protein
VRSLSKAQGVSLDKLSLYGLVVKGQCKRLSSMDQEAMILPSLSLHMQSCRLLGRVSAWPGVFLRCGGVTEIVRSYTISRRMREFHDAMETGSLTPWTCGPAAGGMSAVSPSRRHVASKTNLRP